MPEPVEVVAVLVAAGDSESARRNQLKHLVPDARRIAAIGHGFSQPPTDAELSLGLPQQQKSGIGGLVSSVEINCEFLTLDGWQIEGERRSFGHGGCGAARIREALRLDTGLLRESRGLRYSRQYLSHSSCMKRVSVRSLEAQPRNQSTRKTFSSEGLSGLETMSIREELREVAWLASVIAALSMLGVSLAVVLAAV